MGDKNQLPLSDEEILIESRRPRFSDTLHPVHAKRKDEIWSERIDQWRGRVSKLRIFAPEY